MKRIVLNGRRMKDIAGTHCYLQRKCKFPDYYGKNLDALHDCLTEIGQDTRIILLNSEAAKQNLGEYADGLFSVLEDSFAENRHLTISIRTGWHQ